MRRGDEAYNVSGLIVAMPKGNAAWRILAHFYDGHVRGRKGRIEGWLLMQSLQRPIDIAMQPITEVEELLCSGQLIARCDSVPYTQRLTVAEMREIVAEPMVYLARTGLKVGVCI